MEHVWGLIEELRQRYEVLRADRTPIDVFAFFELDLGLDPIPFDDLTARYRVEAAITADFTGIYLDAEQYALMERGPDWKLNRLRFTVAHELAHYFLRGLQVSCAAAVQDPRGSASINGSLQSSPPRPRRVSIEQ